ncbi:DUF4376 domain-containing protein [Nisaea sediminum]|uniref:DUF4376 domain-containing protein n=1 Tax=Nisaea sediminum TaxID=2775867 RepID=UPI001867AE5B|nr:hypothetical protein [Nisaea sediminum]
MIRYALYRFSDGAFIRHQEFREGRGPAASVAGKGRAWVADPPPALTIYQDEAWDSEAKTSVAVLKPLSEQQAIKNRLIDAKVISLFGEGFYYEIPGSGEKHRYQLDLHVSQFRMVSVMSAHNDGQGNANRNRWRDAENVNVTMSSGQNKAFLRAGKDYVQDIIHNAQDLKDDNVATSTQQEFDAVDVETGIGGQDGSAAGWPNNGS